MVSSETSGIRDVGNAARRRDDPAQPIPRVTDLRLDLVAKHANEMQGAVTHERTPPAAYVGVEEVHHRRPDAGAAKPSTRARHGCACAWDASPERHASRVFSAARCATDSPPRSFPSRSSSCVTTFGTTSPSAITAGA
jgi:hypothetical protein